MMKNILIIFLFLAITTQGVRAESIFKGAGTTGADFLKLGVGARASAMGDAFTGVGGDMLGIHYNPSSLGFIPSFMATLSHNIWFEDIAYNFAAAAFPTKFGTFGGYVRYLYLTKNIKGMELDPVTYSPVPTGISHAAYDLAFGLNYARILKEDTFAAGINLSGISRKLADFSASAFSADIGFLYRLPLGEENILNLALAARNLGTPINFGNVDEQLPVEFRFGLSPGIKINYLHSIMPSLDVIKPIDSSVKINAGVEYNFSDMIFIRGGYKYGYDLENITAGCGFRIKGIQVDYAWVPFGDYFPNTHRISITFPFPEKKTGRIYGTVRARRNPYSHNIEKQVFDMTMKVEEGTKLDTWEVWIEDKDANLIIVWDGAGNDFPAEVSWDGSDMSDNKVVSGEYFYFMRLAGSGGNIYFSPGKKLIIDTVPPQLDVKVSTESFNPESEKLGFKISFLDNLTGISSWKLNIALVATGKVAKVFNGEGNPPDIILWDGKDDYYGEIVPEAKFVYRLYGMDGAGNEGSSHKGQFEVSVPIKVKVEKIKIIKTERGLKIDLASEVLFATGKNVLKPASKEVMENVAKALIAYPENDVAIEGHTDSTGSASYNQKLSERRAKSVFKVLTDDYRIDPLRFTVIGFGESKPVADNKTKAGRLKNRRVEIIILKIK